MEFIYHINCFHTLLKELYRVLGNLIVFLHWSVYELLLSAFAILCFILYLNNNGLPLSPQQSQKKIPGQIVEMTNNLLITGWTMNCWLLYTFIVLECGSIKRETHNYCLYRLHGLIGSTLDHRSLPHEFESRRGHSWFSSLTSLHYL